MAVLWYFAWQKNRIDVIDIGWALGIAFCALLYTLTAYEISYRNILISLLALFWALRLSWLLVSRIKHNPEDPRYAQYRTLWGNKAKEKFLYLFVFQGFLSFILSLAIFAALSPKSNGFNLVDYLGLAIFIIAFFLESLSDKQLTAWKKDPQNKGKVCRAGLWNYSRHPNYFFEWLKWWSYVIFASQGNLWWLSFIGVGVMYYLLVYVTGIPPSEKRSLESRGEEYRQYQKEVNAFVPWFKS